MATKPQNQIELLQLVEKQENSRLSTIELLKSVDGMALSNTVSAGLLKTDGDNVSLTEAGKAALDGK